MRPFFSPGCVRSLAATRLLFACCLLLIAAAPAIAQSTFGSILGTVRDSSGADVQGAQITLVNVGTDLPSAERQSLPLLADDLAHNITVALTEGGW